jgi:shikimate dehydrogenase
MSIVSGAARVAGVTGWPVAHSRSPWIHGFWLRRYNIDGAYVPLPIAPGDFQVAVRGLAAAGFAGVNVTIPHKIAAFQLCDSVDEDARIAGAANTLTFSNCRISGSNTDRYGFLESLREAGLDPRAGPALVLGAGGGARAVVSALRRLGVPVSVATRSPEAAEKLAREFGLVRVVPWAARADGLGGYALLVNATPLGMQHQPALEMPLTGAGPGLAVVDLVYVPLETPLLAEARARGLRAVDGLGMLLHQARPGFAAWFGVDPQVDDELRSFVLADL